MARHGRNTSNNLLPDFLSRVPVENKSSGICVEDLQISPWVNVSKMPSFQPQPVVSNRAGFKKDVEGVPFKVNTLKRSWEAVYEQPQATNGAAFTLGTTPAVFTGLRLAPSSTIMDTSSPQPSTSGFHLLDFAGRLQAHLCKQSKDVDQLIDSQTDAMKQAIEAKRKMHTRALLSLMNEGVAKRLKIKDGEIEKAKARTMELEEGLKQLSLEAQIWKNLAQNNELIVLNLKQNLEQVVVQMRDHHHHQHNHPYHHISREEGCGESELEDAESCQHVGGEGPCLQEHKYLNEQRKCKLCSVNEVCVVVLPCKHLCLCLDCDCRLDRCPLCGIIKNATLQVYT